MGKEVRVVLSNADTEGTRKLYSEILPECEGLILEAPRSISANGKRAKAKELLIVGGPR